MNHIYFAGEVKEVIEIGCLRIHDAEHLRKCFEKAAAEGPKACESLARWIVWFANKAKDSDRAKGSVVEFCKDGYANTDYDWAWSWHIPNGDGTTKERIMNGGLIWHAHTKTWGSHT